MFSYSEFTAAVFFFSLYFLFSIFLFFSFIFSFFFFLFFLSISPPPPRITKRGEAVYFLSEPHLDHLTEAKNWLKERVTACQATEGASSGLACADSVLTVCTILVS